MDLKEAVQKRRSIRAFHSKPVPYSLLEHIMEQALWAPSWGNTQPWGFAIVGGEALNRIKEECLELFERGVEPHPDLKIPTRWDEAQTLRYKRLGRALFQAIGIEREDQQKRNEYYKQMTLCFGAPHMIYLHLAEGFNAYALMDGGLILQTIALLAMNEGLGTCFLARSIIFPEVIRRQARISPDRRLIMGMAVGYPIRDHPANLFPRERARLDELVEWLNG
jgi:nitroreductase